MTAKIDKPDSREVLAHKATYRPLLTSEQTPKKGKLRTSEHWLKSHLPECSRGYYWDVRANANGVIIYLRWREQKKLVSETYPRIGARMLKNLEKQNAHIRNAIIRGWIIAHNRKPETRSAARLGIASR